MKESRDTCRSHVNDLWSNSLEEWLGVGALGPRQAPTPAKFTTAPFETHKPERFRDVPLVAFVATSAGRDFQQALVEGAELIRVSTNGFRCFLFTDDAEVPSSDVAAWHIEQCVPENFWMANSTENWLPVAAKHFQETQAYFGVTHVVAPRTIAEAKETIVKLGARFAARNGIIRRALRPLDRLPTDDSLKRGFRGGWEPSSYASRLTRIEENTGERVKTECTRGAKDATLIGLCHGTNEVIPNARALGWGTALVSAEVDSTANHLSRFPKAVFRAAAEAVGRGSLLIELEQGKGVDTGIDSVSEGKLVALPDEPEWTIWLSYLGTSISFAPEDLGLVLDKLERAYC